jgi:hypothetical protein
MICCETGIAPSVLLEEDHVMVNALHDYLVWRNKQHQQK